MRQITINKKDFQELSDDILQKRNGNMRFEAHGTSMIPFIHNKDILTIQPVNFAELKYGNIAFYRFPDGRASVHRIVDIDRSSGKYFFKIRGDALPSPDEEIQSEQIIGRVIRIERDRKIIDPNHGSYRFLSLIWIQLPYIFRKVLIHLLNPAALCIFILSSVQRIRLYRSLIRKFLGAKINYRPAASHDNSLLIKLYGYNHFPEIKDPNKTFQEQISTLNQHGLIIVATLKNDIVGSGLVRSYPEAKNGFQVWWIFGMLVRMRFRGLGIGENILLKMIEYVKSKHGSRINLFVFESNKIAIKLYKKIGFRQTTIPEISKQLEEEVKQGHRKRILMSYLI